MSAPRRSRRNSLVAIGAAVSLAGLAFFLYQQFTDSDTPADPRNDAKQSPGESSQSSKKQKYKPSLSLSLPTTFLRTPENMILLEGLLSMLSQYYLVTLIAPPPSSPASSTAAASTSPTETDYGVESVAALSQSLSHVVGFDSRRVLEYSKEEGRLALARALACDAHCETMVEAVSLKQVAKGRNSNDGSDGDLTPRATSPALLSHKQKRAEEEKVALLERYHADMAQIRKSSSLLIFLLLPIATSTSQDKRGTESPRLTISEVDVETVIQPFLLPGQQELSSRVPGVKVVDERRRSTEAGIKEAWKQAAKRVGLLSKGWQ